MTSTATKSAKQGFPPNEIFAIAKAKVAIYSHRIPPQVCKDDLVQEACLRLLKYGNKYDSSIANEQSFAHFHAKGAIFDHIRHATYISRNSTGSRHIIVASTNLRVDPEDLNSPEIQIKDTAINSEENLIKQDLIRIIQECIEKLPPKWITIIQLYFYADVNLKDIGVMLRCNQSRVSQIINDALKRLSSLLREGGIYGFSR